MKARKRTWKVTLTVVNDISWCRGSLTKLAPGARIKEIIRDAIDDWRDLEAKNVKVKKL